MTTRIGTPAPRGPRPPASPPPPPRAIVLCPGCGRDLGDDMARACEICDDRYAREYRAIPLSIENAILSLETLISGRMKFDNSNADRVLALLLTDAERMRALAALHSL